jgi:hypothetical protein
MRLAPVHSMTGRSKPSAMPAHRPRRMTRFSTASAVHLWPSQRPECGALCSRSLSERSAGNPGGKPGKPSVPAANKWRVAHAPSTLEGNIP